MMKTIKILIFCLISIIISSCTTKYKKNNIFINSLDNDYIGVYLPLNFINYLNETKDYSEAQYTSSLYQYIIVNKNSISYRYWFHDKYQKIPKKNLRNYQFKLENNEPIIIDDCGNEYIKISDEIHNEIELINTYIAEIVLDELVKLGIIYIENNMVRIPSINIDEWYIPRFRIETFDLHYSKEANLNLYDCEDNEIVYFKIINGIYLIYNYKDNVREIKWIIWRT